MPKYRLDKPLKANNLRGSERSFWVAYRTREDREALFQATRDNDWGSFTYDLSSDEACIFIYNKWDPPSVYAEIYDFIALYNQDRLGEPRPLHRIVLQPARGYGGNALAVYTASDETAVWFFENAPRYGTITSDLRDKKSWTDVGAAFIFRPNPVYDLDRVTEWLQNNAP